MSSQASFQFGVEIELLLGGRKKAYSSWMSLAKDVSKKLAQAGISNHINEGNSKSRDNYREWSIVQEVTIPNQPAKNLWGIELVSPVYPVAWYWAGDLDTIFKTIRGSFTPVPSSHCSTHVHISGTPTPLSPEELTALAKAALYFEPALDALVPSARRGSEAYWCQSNHDSQALKNYDLADCFAVLDGSSSSTRAVVEAMNLAPASSAYGRAHGKKHDFVRGKVYKWDFTGMLSKAAGGTGLGTVEFRQAPGSLSYDDANGWVTLALSFVATATGNGFDVVDAGNGASVEELWAMLISGATTIGLEGVATLGDIFAHGEA